MTSKHFFLGRIETGDFIWVIYYFPQCFNLVKHGLFSSPICTVTPGATKDSDFGGWVWLPGVSVFFGVGVGLTSSVGPELCVFFFFFRWFLSPSGKFLTKLNDVTYIFLKQNNFKGFVDDMQIHEKVWDPIPTTGRVRNWDFWRFSSCPKNRLRLV